MCRYRWPAKQLNMHLPDIAEAAKHLDRQVNARHLVIAVSRCKPRPLCRRRRALSFLLLLHHQRQLDYLLRGGSLPRCQRRLLLLHQRASEAASDPLLRRRLHA